MQLLNQNVAFPKFINRVQEHFTDFFNSCSSCRFSSILADFPLYSEIIQVQCLPDPRRSLRSWVAGGQHTA